VIEPTDAASFSLTNCGPVDRALLRVGLKSADPPYILFRAFLPAAIIWLPLLAVALLRPQQDGGAAISFFDDLATHVRFLVVVPLLLLVELGIGRRTRLVAAQFVHANLISPAEKGSYDALLHKAGRAFDSSIAEAIVAALAVFFVWKATQQFASDGTLFWFEEPAAGGSRLTTAGWWYAIGSWLPPFLFLRWFWRYLVWSWFLYRTSRLDLQLVATHPDYAAGLGFVSFGHTSFAMLGFTVSCLVAGAVGTRILHEGATLVEYQWALAVFVGISIFTGLAPLAVFLRPLRIAKERGLLAYGTLASRYVQEFQRKWIGTKAGDGPLEASGDVQGLADIGGSLDRVLGMRLLPITLKSAVAFAVSALIPMFPLLLTVMPLKDLVKLLMQAMI
jgi:hypothetical protein